MFSVYHLLQASSHAIQCNTTGIYIRLVVHPSFFLDPWQISATIVPPEGYSSQNVSKNDSDAQITGMFSAWVNKFQLSPFS